MLNIRKLSIYMSQYCVGNNLLQINQKKIVPILSRLHIFRVVICSASIEPTICAGEKVLIRRFSIRRVRVGDIIAFSSLQKIVVHRVLNVSTTKGGRVFQTKGDNATKPDVQLVTARNYIGRVERDGLLNHLYHLFPTQTIDKVLTIGKSLRKRYSIPFGKKFGKLFKRNRFF